ncbi:acetyltransferase, GNAT family [Hyaloraphidium curvatum]|nr:acetyltransferase, GNAT family [Hyaloraphidium curvatum]
MAAVTVKIVPATAEHFAAWSKLYAGYAEFYKVAQTPEMRERVWGWIQDPAHEVKGLLALDEAGVPIGLAHYRPFSRPLSATTGGFLDDLFVDPAQRAGGVGQKLIEAVAAIGKEKGWSVIRWITADNNYRARGMYDKVATRTMWITYDHKIE